MNTYMAILPALSALFCLGLGIFVITRNFRHPTNVGFSLGMAALFVMDTGNTLSLLSDNEALALFWKRVAMSGQVFLPPAWLLFSLTAFRTNYQEVLVRWKPALIGTAFFSLFFLFWLPSSRIISLFPGDETGTLFLLGPAGKAFFIFLLLGMVLNLIHLENTFRIYGQAIRSQTQYLLFGVGAILAFQIYLASQALLYSSLNADWVPPAAAVRLIAEGFLLFFIIGYRLLDADVFISRYVIYNSLTVLFVGAYLLYVGFMAQAIRWFGGPELVPWVPAISFLALLAGLILFLSKEVRRRVQLYINRHFYRNKHDYRSMWMQTTERMGSTTSLEAIQKTLLTMIQETLGAREIALYLYNPEQKGFYRAESTFPGGSSFFKEDHPMVRQMLESEVPFPLYLQEGSEKGTVLCTPLIAGQETVGFLLQGEDLAGVPYNTDDFEILKAISTHAAGQIKNIRLSKALVASKEAETFHQVSSFFIHDMKNFVSTLSLLAQNAREYIGNPSFQQDALRTLQTTVSKMNGMISQLTLLSRTLEIRPLPSDLDELLDQTLSTLNGQASARIERETEKVPPVFVDREQFQKVILNLVLNAMEASPGEGKIRIRSYHRGGDVVLAFSDQGCGMSEDFIQSSLFKPFKTTKPNGLGIGLFQCKKIVEAHGGKIEVESREGKGSEFRVILPG